MCVCGGGGGGVGGCEHLINESITEVLISVSRVMTDVSTRITLMSNKIKLTPVFIPRVKSQNRGGRG